MTHKMQMNLSFFFKGQFFPYFSSGAFASVLKKVPRVQDRGVSFTFGAWCRQKLSHHNVSGRWFLKWAKVILNISKL